MNFAAKAGVVVSMLQKTGKINNPVRMSAWIHSGYSPTYQDLWHLHFILCPIAYGSKIRWVCRLYELDEWSTMKYHLKLTEHHLTRGDLYKIFYAEPIGTSFCSKGFLIFFDFCFFYSSEGVWFLSESWHTCLMVGKVCPLRCYRYLREVENNPSVWFWGVAYSSP